MKKQSDIRHLYLYAKGHYIRDDRNEDLQKIVSVITGVPAEHVDPSSILYWLTTEVYKQIKNYDRFFEFISVLLPDSFWAQADMDNYDIIVQKCLSVMAFTNIDDIDIEIGEPDKEVLPLFIDKCDEINN